MSVVTGGKEGHRGMGWLRAFPCSPLLAAIPMFSCLNSLRTSEAEPWSSFGSLAYWGMLKLGWFGVRCRALPAVPWCSLCLSQGLAGSTVQREKEGT